MQLPRLQQGLHPVGATQDSSEAARGREAVCLFSQGVNWTNTTVHSSIRLQAWLLFVSLSQVHQQVHPRQPHLSAPPVRQAPEDVRAGAPAGTAVGSGGQRGGAQVAGQLPEGEAGEDARKVCQRVICNRRRGCGNCGGSGGCGGCRTIALFRIQTAGVGHPGGQGQAAQHPGQEAQEHQAWPGKRARAGECAATPAAEPPAATTATASTATALPAPHLPKTFGWDPHQAAGASEADAGPLLSPPAPLSRVVFIAVVVTVTPLPGHPVSGPVAAPEVHPPTVAGARSYEAQQSTPPPLPDQQQQVHTGGTPGHVLSSCKEGPVGRRTSFHSDDDCDDPSVSPLLAGQEAGAVIAGVQVSEEAVVEGGLPAAAAAIQQAGRGAQAAAAQPSGQFRLRAFL